MIQFFKKVKENRKFLYIYSRILVIFFNRIELNIFTEDELASTMHDFASRKIRSAQSNDDKNDKEVNYVIFLFTCVNCSPSLSSFPGEYFNKIQ